RLSALSPYRSRPVGRCRLGGCRPVDGDLSAYLSGPSVRLSTRTCRLSVGQPAGLSIRSVSLVPGPRLARVSHVVVDRPAARLPGPERKRPTAGARKLGATLVDLAFLQELNVLLTARVKPPHPGAEQRQHAERAGLGGG